MAKRKTKKKASRKKATSHKKSDCKIVTVCGKRRRICWKNGRISSNKPASRKAS